MPIPEGLVTTDTPSGIPALVPEGTSSARFLPQADGERHTRATHQVRRPSPCQKAPLQLTLCPCRPCPFQLGDLIDIPLIALGPGDPRTLARRPEHAESFTFSWWVSPEDDSSGVPTMPAPEGVVTADTPSVSASSSLSVGSIGWPSSLSDQETCALWPEDLSTRSPSPPAGERHDERTTHRGRRPCPRQKVWSQPTLLLCRPCRR
eukprot:5770021-Pleurochrysis_carterae.AAC.1